MFVMLKVKKGFYLLFQSSYQLIKTFQLAGEIRGLCAAGDRLGRLLPHRGQEGVHGRRPDHAGRSRPVQHCDRVVQAVWYLVPGECTARGRQGDG